MAFQTKSILAAIATVAAATSGVTTVVQGVPLSLTTRLGAWVAMAGQDVDDDGNGTLKRQARFVVLFGYRVDAAQNTAEQALADVVDAFIPALYGDAPLRALTPDMSLDLSGADQLQYVLLAGQEGRLYPVTVRCEEWSSYT